MKKFAAILGILALAACMAFVGQPRPKLTLWTTTVPGLVWVHYSVVALGGVDSVVVTVTQNSPAVTTNKKLLPTALEDSTSFPRPAFGTSISGSGAARSWRRALSVAGSTKAWGYAEPGDVAPPAPSFTFDSVTAR